MPAKKAARKPKELTVKELDYSINIKPTGVKTSRDLQECKAIIGQDKAISSIKLGLDVKSIGYNIFVTGPAGTGRTTTIKMLLEQLSVEKPNLNDYCYVNNFKNDDRPTLLTFTPGDGRRFKKDMNYLISSIRKAVPKILSSDDYKDRYSRITREFEKRQKDLIHLFEDKLTKAGFVMVQIQSGVGVRNEIHPLIKEEPVSLDKLEQQANEGQFSLSKLDELRRRWDSLRRDFDTTSTESKKLTEKLEDALDKMNYSIIAPFVSDKVNLIRKRYPIEKVSEYLDDVEEAMLSDFDRFREAQPRRGEEEAPPFRKREPFEEFAVNLILDNAETEKTPIIIEKSPTYKNLFGSIERVVDRFGYWRTDFTRVFAGSLLRAAGGYLVINALDLFSEPGAWPQLKRTLRNRELEIAGYDPFYMMAGAGIKPEPINLDIKVVIIGEARVYNMLWHHDEDFRRIFKVKAEFDTVMELNSPSIKRYFEFVGKIINDEHLPHFDLTGLQAIGEYGRRLSGDREHLSTRFTLITDIIRESAYCTQQRKAKLVTRQDVHCATVNRRNRVNMMEEKIQQMFDENTIMVSTTGVAVGQINGLSVYNLGEYSFGRPTRITVATSLGKGGIINIEREADLSGPLHNKGVLIISGYLRQIFAQKRPLTMSASISFEQSYSGVDGDSASSTEIYAILSSLADIPIKQSIAVTGSVNQKGEIQPIGGVNEKIEGFFDVCKNRRLTGHQGVMIPHQNVKDLMLRPDVIKAVKEGKFHIYPVKTINEGIEVLTGKPAGTKLSTDDFSKGSVLAAVHQRLDTMAFDLQNFSQSINDKSKLSNSKNKSKSK